MESRDGGTKDEEVPASLVRTAAHMARRWCDSPADAEDVAQDAMVLLLRQLRRPVNPVAWLFVVTRRLSHRNRLRSRARLDAEQVYGISRARPGPDCDLALEARGILSRLTQRDRKLLLWVLEGTSSREIATAFGCQVRDVGTMVSRARRKAKRIREECQKSKRSTLLSCSTSNGGDGHDPEHARESAEES